MEKKVGLGVEFFVTSSVYDLKQLKAFMQQAKTFGIPVIAGLMVLKSAGMARYINKHVEGVVIPEEIIERLMKAPDKLLAAIEIAAETIRGIKGLCQGVSIISMGWEDKVPAILDAIEG
jgi:methylenetetrahydrofolate reductase (NADPH)